MSNQIVVRCYFKTFGDFVTVYSTSSGHGGFFIATNEELAQDTPVRLEFKLRNDYPLITGEGTVVGTEIGGFSVEFTQLDDDSEKFLNEVVKVKAAELKIDPSAPLPTFDSQVEKGAGGDDLDDAFADLADVGVEEAAADSGELPADTFGELNLEEPAASATDHFDSSLDEPAPETGQSGGEPFNDDEYEDVEEQSPANPQALFEDIPADSDGAHANMPASGGTTKVLDRFSTLKERRALLIGAGVGLVAVVLGGAGWFFFLRAPAGVPVVQVPPKVESAPAAVTTTAAAPVSAVAQAPASVSAPASAAPVAPAAVPPPPPSAPAPKLTPVAVAAPPPPVSAKPLTAASKVTSIEAQLDGSIVILGDGAFGRVKHFGMSEPNRIVVDLFGVDKGFAGLNRAGQGAVVRIRPGVHEGKIRLVLDLKSEAGPIPPYTLDKEGDRITVRVR